MKTYNDLGEVYFVECSNCGKHSTEVNDYWNDDDELFICDCGHPMFDGWEDEEPGEPTEEAAIEYHVKCDNCGKIFNTTKIIIDNIEAGTEACPNCGVTGCLVKFQPTEGTAKIKAKLSHGVDHGFTGKQAIGLIVIGVSVNGIEVDPAHFFHAEKVEKIRQGQKGFLFSYDIGYRKCLERYPEINDFQNGEKPTEKKSMPEHVRDYLTFEELPLELQNRIIRTDKLFCQKHGFQQDPSEIRNNLYHKDGSLACMTRKEREDWYTSKEKSKTETV
jgi:DNA-directed RNA polymerase subunit RPC12/RpoP